MSRPQIDVHLVAQAMREAVIAMEAETGMGNFCWRCGVRFWTKDNHQCADRPLEEKR